MTNRTNLIVGVSALLWALGVASAEAQSLGSFTWQLQPFCNKVAVTVTQNGGTYTVDGYDDQCGGVQRAPLVGVATPNPDGSIGLGLAIVTAPGGRPVHVDARIALASLGGPWFDSAGNSGAFVFNGNAAGAARPAPTVPGTVLAVGSVPGTAIANGAIGTAQIATSAVSSAQTSNEPGISHAFNAGAVNLPATATTVASTAMRVPANGFVKIEVSGNWWNGGAGADIAECQLMKGALASFDFAEPYFSLSDRNAASEGNTVFSAHRIVPVAVADNPVLITLGQPFRLVCEEVSGAVRIANVHISATYYASSYEPLGIGLPLDSPTAVVPAGAFSHSTPAS